MSPDDESHPVATDAEKEQSIVFVVSTEPILYCSTPARWNATMGHANIRMTRVVSARRLLFLQSYMELLSHGTQSARAARHPAANP